VVLVTTMAMACGGQVDYAAAGTPMAQCTDHVELTQEIVPGPVSHDDFRLYALAAGWPCSLLDEVEAVAFCESRHNSDSANTAGLEDKPSHQQFGLLQLVPLWFSYAGTNIDFWADPQVNLYTARQAYLYDVERGNEPWTQWSCKP